ncbi:MAG: VOC family protein [Thermoplasmata archaeon]|nr:VOC family protein [Thermoplasmata archaeon]
MLALADVAVVVSDAKASAQWWTEKLGFATHTLEGSGHAVLVAPPGERLLLHLCEGYAPLEPGNTGIAFMTDDLKATVARWSRAGVQFPDPPEPGTESRMARFADPDGNVFWLVGAPAAFVRKAARLRAPTVARKKPRRPTTTRRARR